MKITLAQIAEEAGIESRSARRILRGLFGSQGGRWSWEEGDQELEKVRKALVVREGSHTAQKVSHHSNLSQELHTEAEVKRANSPKPSQETAICLACGGEARYVSYSVGPPAGWFYKCVVCGILMEKLR